MDSSLSAIAKHNFQALGVEVQTINAEASEVLNTMDPAATIYIDPARRSDDNTKVVSLERYTPNVIELLEDIQFKTHRIILKVSPLFDITAGLRQLSRVLSVHVLAIDNEVKEVLFVMDRDATEATFHAVELGKQPQSVTFSGQDLRSADRFGEIGDYLYEPHAAIMKLGAWAGVSSQRNLHKIAPQSHLYTSKTLQDNLMGRTFKVLEVIEYKPKRIKSVLPNPAHIATRNFPEKAQQIRSRFKLKDGGNHYLFFTTDSTGKKIVIVCEKTAPAA